MKIPRDLTGQQFIKYLKVYGYNVTRKSGSHIRLTTHVNGEHHITIPDHDPLKIGTLGAILADIAMHLNKSKGELIQELFG